MLAGLLLIGLAACQPTTTRLGPGNLDTGAPTKLGGTASTTTPRRTTPTTSPPRTTTTTAAPRTTSTTAAATTTAAPITTTTAAPASPSTPGGWKLVGGDEFNDTSVNGGKWSAYHSNYGSSNLQLECNTPANVSEAGGSVRITAKKQAVSCPSGGAMRYTSGFLGSRETGTYYPRYARFEMRAKVPHAQGLWPAFWLRHRGGAGVAEVDIMEYFHSQVPGKSTQTLHLDGVSNVSKKTTAFENPAATPGFHTWAVEILPDPGGVRFSFFVDNVKVHTYVDATHAWTSADAAGTWDIALNLAVGGRWVGSPDGTLGLLELLNRCSISGTAPGGCSTTGIHRVDWADPAEATFAIDYVRVYTPV